MEITVVVVDDHPLFRQGVVDALSAEAGVRVLGQSSTGEDAVRLIRRLQPQVAVVDINMPGMNGQQLARLVSAEKLPTRVILMTAYDDSEQAVHAALSGAAGYCSKDIEPEVLRRAIAGLADGGYFVGGRVVSPGEFKRWLEGELLRVRRPYSEPGSAFHPLTDREMEVLTCVVRGQSNKEIALLLGISHQTVKNHVTSILRKFGVDDRTQAVVYALKHGWVKLPQEPKDQEKR